MRVSRRWALGARWPALVAAVLALPIIAITAHGTLFWPGRTFPGFFVMGDAVVPTIGLRDWTGMRAGIPFHARILAVDDRPVSISADVYDHVGRLPPGTPVSYTLVKRGETLVRVVPTMRFAARDYWLTVGLYLAFGLVSVGAGVVVAILQPRTAAARAFLNQGFLTGLFAFTGTALYHPDLWWLSRLHFLTQALFPASFIHLGLVFPVERLVVARRPWLLALPYAIGLVLAAWVFRDFYANPPDTTPLYASYLYSALAIAALLGLVAYAYWEHRTPFVRARLHVVFPGLVIGTALALYGFVNISRSGGDFPMNLIALGPAVFYLSIAYAIAKHDLFDIDELVRQAVVYATLTLAITAVYAGSVVALSLLLPPSAVRASPVFNIGFVVLVAVAFQPARAAVQRLLDRTFYRGRPDYRRTVRELSAALTTLLDRDEILARIGRTVSDGLQLRSLAILFWLDEGTQLWRFNAATRRMESAAADSCEAVHRTLEAGEPQPLRVDEHADEPASESDDPDAAAARVALASLGVSLLVPFSLGSRVIGTLALGPKRSGRPFSSEDLALLETLAAQCAIALQNAHSYQALQTLNRELEAKVQARTAELEHSNTDLATSNAELERAYRELQAAQAQLVQSEKMASLGLLVAGVAHEINNPVSFIVSNVKPLRRRLEGLRALAAGHPDSELSAGVDRVREVFDIIARGAERTAGIVNDLRTFSRPGDAQTKAVDLHEGIEVSLRLLHPRWAERIIIHRDYGPLPPVEAAAGEINQVLMNILANACDAISGRGNVWIRTTHEGSAVRVSIRDDGAGIRPEHLSRIFDPFFTTKPPGKGTGLGLAISHGLVAHHGGTIEVESEPGVGTEFTIVLPVHSVAAAS
ncbi:MAG: GAF domain-containing protein [Deltaproteobacteria bacterium]|nr:GAF domain-containing protein [Deltaproteobacteria bacterium]